jgi:OOP family OmpA-OmpF porin
MHTGKRIAIGIRTHFLHNLWTITMKPSSKILFLGILATAITPLISAAQEISGQANWSNTSKNIWRSSDGKCVRSTFWTPDLATPECDPDLFKKAEAPPPSVAQSEPPPANTAQPAQAEPEQPEIVTAPKKVSYSTADLFDFNNATLKDDGKARLDSFVEELKGARFNTIVATGYADRIGSTEYNQKLSEMRAQAVRDYLVQKGIPADRIRAEGRGESDPVTAVGECKGRLSPKLIACLQPDRRVEVEMDGTEEVVVSTE